MGLAVAKTSAPMCWASWIAAIPTPPAPAWISTLSPAFRLGEVDQAVVGGEEDDRAPRRPARRSNRPGIGAMQVALGDGQRAEGVRDHPHHPVARREVRHLGADLDHDPGALAADRAGFCPG